MKKPILVLGSARNGTTWLSNTLCEHPKITGVQHRVHWGLHESNIYSNIQYWGNFADNDEFIKFFELYSSGDYFRLAGGKKEYFYRNRPDDFTEFFFELMDRYSSRKGVDRWVTKLDPLFYSRPEELNGFFYRLKSRYGRFKLIAIKRDFEKVLDSYLNMQGRKGQGRGKPVTRELSAILETVRHVYHYNCIERIISDRNGLILSFDLFRNERSEALKKIGEYLNIGRTQSMSNVSFPANSSFSNRDRVNYLPDLEKKFIFDFLYPLISHTRNFNQLILRFRDFVRGNQCPLYWRLLKLENMEEAFKKELSDKGEEALLDLLFGEVEGGQSR